MSQSKKTRRRNLTFGPPVRGSASQAFGETRVTKIRLKQDTRDRLDELADERNVSLNLLINELLASVLTSDFD